MQPAWPGHCKQWAQRLSGNPHWCTYLTTAVLVGLAASYAAPSVAYSSLAIYMLWAIYKCYTLLPPRSVVVPATASVLTGAGLSTLAALALLAGQSTQTITHMLTPILLLVILMLLCFHLWAFLDNWQQVRLRVQRQLPGALSLGKPTEVTLTLFNESDGDWHIDVFDEVDPTLAIQGLPQTVLLPAESHVTVRYTVTAHQRGVAHFGGTQVRWRRTLSFLHLRQTLGEPQHIRIYPDFAAVARYAWLSGDRRLAQIGIKTWPKRGQGTDFRQLADYRPGDALRHIDWKATQRRQRPTVREYQDDRDQRILFLLDCGRRMRADESGTASHFDETLNALMLLAHVALHEGDEVGAMTFGMPQLQQRDFAPRKGAATLNALMNRLHDIQPTPTHSDYLAAARRLLVTQRRRSLVIVLTNFRDEDVGELRPAMQLLRTRHLVLLASLRERVLDAIAAQPLLHEQDAVDTAAAHLFTQSRRDAFARVTQGNALSLDVEPAQLAVALVNRYHAIKRAGML